MAYSGSCLCGAVTYASYADAVFQGNCYCKDCHKESGSGHITAIGLPTASFHQTGGTSVYDKPADSGGTLAIHFCSKCGTTLFTRPTNAPGMTLIRAGTLDGDVEVTPQMNLYAPHAPELGPRFAGDPRLCRDAATRLSLGGEPARG